MPECRVRGFNRIGLNIDQLEEQIDYYIIIVKYFIYSIDHHIAVYERVTAL